MSDEDLIFLMSAGSEAASMAFYARYNEHAWKIAKAFFKCHSNHGIAVNEFYTVAFEATYIALRQYKNIRGRFYPYWNVTAMHDMVDYLNENSYVGEAKPLGGVSLDSVCYINNERQIFHDVIGSEDDESNELSEVVRHFIVDDNKVLTDEEKILANLLLLENLSAGEIIKITGWKRNKYSYLLRKLRTKMQKILKENYL